MKKVLIVSAWAPPMTGGSPTLLGKFLRRFPIGSYVFLTDYTARYLGTQTGNWLSARYYFAGDNSPRSTFQEFSDNKNEPAKKSKLLSLIWHRLINPLYEVIDIIYKINLVTNQGVGIIKQEKPDIILGTSDDGVFLISSYLVSKKTRTTLYIHLLDLYARNNYSFFKKILARLYEPRILRQAKKVFVTNDKTRKFYQDLYGIDPIVIPHITKIPGHLSKKIIRKKPLIRYTGAVYWAQKDSVINLVKALKYLPQASLNIYSAATKEQLIRNGAWSSQVSLYFAKEGAMAKEQARADILFLPMGFNTPAQEIVRTAAPGKMPEYLVSGVPILVHAAPDDYIAEYARKEGWGLVVDKRDPKLLASAIRKLLTNEKLRQQLVNRAYEVAKKHHDEEKVIPTYLRHFQ